MAVSMQLLSVGKFAIRRKIVCEFEKSIPELFHLKSKASLVETTTTTKKKPHNINKQTNKTPSSASYNIIAMINKILRHPSIINLIL